MYSFTPNHYTDYSGVINDNHRAVSYVIQDDSVGHEVQCEGAFVLFLPVQCIAHLYGYQDRQSHSHGIRRFKD